MIRTQAAFLFCSISRSPFLFTKAIHLMPDVERKAFDITSKRAKSRQQQEQAVDRETTNKGQSSDMTNESEEIDLVQSFNSMTLQTRGSTALCQPEDPEAIKVSKNEEIEDSINWSIFELSNEKYQVPQRQI